MDCHHAAENAYNQSRPCGSAFWIELSVAERERFADLVKAVDNYWSTTPPEWCPSCEELQDKIHDFENEQDDLYDEIDELKAEIQRLKELPSWRAARARNLGETNVTDRFSSQ